MKQAQSGTTSPVLAGRWWSLGSGAPRPMGRRRRRVSAGFGGFLTTTAGSLGRAVLALLATIWFVATLPFRLVFWVMALLGRLAGIAVGFTLMVAGMFFLAGPFILIGIPLFLIGLVLTLRCLE
jgi:hypothetical protein